MKISYYDCPRFDSCCVNNCPLSSEKYISDESDSQGKCTMEKQVRMRIAKVHNLASLGLTTREQKAMKRWADMPEEEKQAKIEKLKKISLLYKLSGKGYAVVRKSKDSSSVTQIKGDISSKNDNLQAGTELQEISRKRTDLGENFTKVDNYQDIANDVVGIRFNEVLENA